MDALIIGVFIYFWRDDIKNWFKELIKETVKEIKEEEI